MTPPLDSPVHDTRAVRADSGVLISSRGFFVALLYAPILLIFGLATVLCAALVVLPGVPIFLRLAGLAVVPLTATLSWLAWCFLFPPKRAQVRITKHEIQLLSDDKATTRLSRKKIGCVVRWDTRMYVFDHRDHLIGEWNLGWVIGIRSEHRFKRAMRRYDYPSRIFYCRPRPMDYRGPGGSSEYVETDRTGAMERELGVLKLGDKWVWPGDAVIQPGPGLSAGPMAEYVAALGGGPRQAGMRADQP
jgi:hypothetical protein